MVHHCSAAVCQLPEAIRNGPVTIIANLPPLQPIFPISLPILESFLTTLTLSQVWLRKGVHNDLSLSPQRPLLPRAVQ